MFEYVNSQKQTKSPGHRALTTIVSVVVHVVVLLVVFLIPIMYFTPVLPASPEMLAFVAAPPPPSPPPPPPPPPARPPSRPQTPRPNPTPMPGRETAPVEAPQSIEPEAPPVPGIDAGLLGGVEGGVEGGVVGGIVGGLVSAAPLPPPPPAPTAAPVRVGGQIKAPALISRVEPVYPTLAQVAQVEGVVILEATVDEAGCVASVRVLRSAGLLDDAAVEAVKQWRYSPLRLNGHPQSFVLTVTVAFHLG